MLKNQKKENIYLKLVTNENNFMDALRQNIGILRTYFGWSMRTLADEADTSENTLNNIVKGRTRDCDQSLTIKLARAFGISVDELIGAKTLEPETQEVLAMSRMLSQHHRYVIRLYARHQYELHANTDEREKTISVIMPECKNGHLKTTIIDKSVNITKLMKPMRDKVRMGVLIPCDHYEPHFLKNEIILLAFDREGENNEKCVISSGGYMYICIKKIQFVNGKKEVNYLSIANDKKIFSFDEISERYGYVVGWLEPENPDDENTTYSWGER